MTSDAASPDQGQRLCDNRTTVSNNHSLPVAHEHVARGCQQTVRLQCILALACVSRAARSDACVYSPICVSAGKCNRVDGFDNEAVGHVYLDIMRWMSSVLYATRLFTREARISVAVVPVPWHRCDPVLVATTWDCAI